MRKLVEVIGANGTYAAVDPKSVMRIRHEPGRGDSAGIGCRIDLECGQALFVNMSGHDVYQSLFAIENGDVSENKTDDAPAASYGIRAYDEIIRLLVESPDDSAGELATAILAIVRSIIKKQKRGNFTLTELDREYNFAIDRMLGLFTETSDECRPASE